MIITLKLYILENYNGNRVRKIDQSPISVIHKIEWL